MPPTGDKTSLKADVVNYISQNRITIFSKSTCPYCAKVKELLKKVNLEYFALELDLIENGKALQDTLDEMTGQKTVPSVFVNGQFLGGYETTIKAHTENRLVNMVNETPPKYDYDLVVIGGGSGGMAAAKEAAGLGAKVACLDFVKPSPRGTTWGLGGTCVNVGCIPKKLMHQASILGHGMEDARKFGWEIGTDVKHNWETMKNAVQDHIGSLNWNYRVQFRDKHVTYFNSYAEFIDPHKIKATNKRGKVQEISSKYFILAMGGRPKYPDIPNALDCCITSDDLFSLPYCPGKTLMIGASYVSLECAGFLAGLGLDVTVMVRSILLRGFDQGMAEKIGEYMEQHNVRIIRPCVPTKIEKIEDGQPGKIRVTAKMQDSNKEVTGEYNTVMMAVGRDPCTSGMGLDKIGVKLSSKGFVVSEDEQTNIPHIYAVGDILEGKPELTPVAIHAGKLLSRRLFGSSSLKMDYTNVPTTVFTPLEYGCIGLAEEDAIAKYGESDIEVYHSNFWPLEWTVAQREENTCYAKLVCVKSQQEKVVGFHVVGPNAGEITQGWVVGMRLGATKADFDNAVGIHPTCAEIFTMLKVTRSSGDSIEQAGC